MAYDAGFAPPERPYAGSAAQRPSSRGQQGYRPHPQQQYNGGEPQRYDSHQQQQRGYSNDEYQGDYGYGQDYEGGHHQSQGYQREQRQPPPGQYDSHRAPPAGRGYPRGGGAPRPGDYPGDRRGGRGGVGGGRPEEGYSDRGGRGRAGPPGPPGRSRGDDRRYNGGPGPGRGAMAEPRPRQEPMPRRKPPGGSGMNPTRPGPDASNYGLADQMANMDINEQGRGWSGADERPPPQAPGAGSYSNSLAGQQSPGEWSHHAQGGYGAGELSPISHEFGPPSRSRTMPVEDPGLNGMHAPRRTGTMPINGSMARQPVAPQRQQPPQHAQYGDYGTNEGQLYEEPAEDAYEDGFDAYYGTPQPTMSGHASHERAQSSVPDFDTYQTTNGRGSFEQSMRPAAQAQPQPGAHQTARVSHAKSQPNLRQPQAAVIEMAPDVPAMPPAPPTGMYQGQAGYEPNYGSYGGYGQGGGDPRAPSAPPGSSGSMTRQGYPQGPLPDRAANNSSARPTPVRAGLMTNSMVNVAERPPPVRNYNGISLQSPTPVPQGGAPVQPQQQQQQQQQQPNGRQKRAPEPPVTPGELEQLRMAIKNNPNDQASALRLAKRLIQAADVLAPNIPDPKARGRARERYLVDAQKILKKLANAQNPEAMFFLADCLGRGLFGNEPDNKEAFTLYLESAKLGWPAAAYRTAVCCEIGHEEGGGTRKDPLKAIQWYKRAAQLGDPPGMYKMGMIQLKGLLGQPRNPREAIGWLQRAADMADSDNPHALHELGLLYESATGPNEAVPRDERRALSLFQQAAEMGYKFSQFRLGCAFEYGLLGCRVEPRDSIRWYSQAAQQQEHQSELALSGWYLTGSENVLGQSDTEAYLWARKAAMAGLAKAEYAMGYFTEVGIGVPANLEDAKRWYWRAAAQDFPKARERLEDLKRAGKGGGPRPREQISRSRIVRQQDGDCLIM